MKTSRGDPKVAEHVIRQLTAKRVQNQFQVTTNTIRNWRKQGFPQYIEVLLRSQYPDLYAFHHIPEYFDTENT